MMTLNYDAESDDERERERLMKGFVRELQEHVSVARIDEDGTLRRIAQILMMKRGCRR